MTDLCPACGNSRRPGRFHACVDGRLRHDVDDRPPKMTAKEAHLTTREDSLPCQGCGVAVSVVIEIPNATPQQVDDARRVMRALHEYQRHGLVKLVPVESHADRKIREGWRRSGRASD